MLPPSLGGVAGGGGGCVGIRPPARPMLVTTAAVAAGFLPGSLQVALAFIAD